MLRFFLSNGRSSKLICLPAVDLIDTEISPNSCAWIFLSAGKLQEYTAASIVRMTNIVIDNDILFISVMTLWFKSPEILATKLLKMRK